MEAESGKSMEGKSVEKFPPLTCAQMLGKISL